MSPILWLKIAFFITLFPGGIYLIIRRILSSHRKSMTVYLITLVIVAIVNTIILKINFNRYIEIILILIIPFTYYFFEYVIRYKRFNILSFKANKTIIYVLVFFPIFEEVVYRFFIFKYCSVLGFSGIQAMIFATLCFEFSHIYYLGFKAINKLFFSFIQSMLFLVFQSLLLIICWDCKIVCVRMNDSLNLFL